ncbi:MAG: hypothetical protein GWP05_07810 [Anaerolineaceae bacterium]|nr:hypothetical protein [Anaerolineaceae bacterium]
MIRLRNSTIFKLLCGTIGLLALALLCMVSLMVYDSLTQAEETTNEGPIEPRASSHQAPPIDRLMSSMGVRLSPEAKAEESQEPKLDLNAKQSYGGWKYIGNIREAGGDYRVLMQNQKTGNQVWWKKGEVRDEIEIKTLADDKIAVVIKGQPVTLARTEAVYRKTVQRRRSSSSRSSRTSGSNVSSASIRENYVAAQAGVVRTSGSGGSAVTARSSRPPRRTGRDWNKYWAERVKKAKQQAAKNKARSNQ